MPTANPPARVWCLRFKLNRTTILLHTDAQQTFSSIRSELLTALKSTNPSGTLHGTLRDGTPVSYPLPESAEDIALAKPADINDASAGWEAIGDDALDELDFEDESTGAASKGKGKAKATPQQKRASKSGGVNDCPQGAGLRDGAVVAFRFRSAEEKGRRRRLAEGSLDVDEIARDGMGDDAVGWDVIVPTMEETYGEEDAAAAEAAAARVG